MADLILHKVLFLVVLYWNAARLRGAVIVEVCQLHTRTGSCYLEWFFILVLLLSLLLLFASFIEESEVVLVFLLCPCILCLPVSLLPLFRNCLRGWGIVSLGMNLVYIFYWNLRQSTSSTTLAKNLTSVLFLWGLNEICLLAEELVTLIPYTVFYYHGSCSPVLNSEHWIRSICPRCWRVLVTLRAHNCTSYYAVRSSIRCTRSVRPNFKRPFYFSGYMLLKVIIMCRSVTVDIVWSPSFVRCWMVLVTLLKKLISLMLNQHTRISWSVVVKTFICQEIVLFWMVCELWLNFFNWDIHLKMSITWRRHNVCSNLWKTLVIQ